MADNYEADLTAWQQRMASKPTARRYRLGAPTPDEIRAAQPAPAPVPAPVEWPPAGHCTSVTWDAAAGKMVKEFVRYEGVGYRPAPDPVVEYDGERMPDYASESQDYP